MKKDIIEKILIIWDPYGTVGYGPINEYSFVCADIESIMVKDDFSIVKLTEYLKTVDNTHDTTIEKIDALVSLLVELNSMLK